MSKRWSVKDALYCIDNLISPFEYKKQILGQNGNKPTLVQQILDKARNRKKEER